MTSLARRPGALLGAALILTGLLVACGAERKAPGQVHILTWDGNVNPIMVRYVERGIDTAERSDAAAVVLRLDTPGGLDSSMRKVIKRIEASRVPVIVYVSPAGGRAASAGTFITMAGHVAAMAPNTTIGAATPIASSGEDIEGALGRKVTNDAVAYIRSIAELRGRNTDWAESAVREAAAATATQAVELSVVDFIATDVTDLLAQADGRSAQVYTREDTLTTVTMRTRSVATVSNDVNTFESLLDVFATPDVAFLLLSLGGLMLLIEIITPGFGIGVFGVICLILAYFVLGALPTNWAGVALILLGLALLATEVFVSGFGILGIGGIVSLIVGGLILTGSSEAGFQVSRWLVIGVGVAVGAIVLLFIAGLVRTRRMAVRSGKEELVGAKGLASTALEPSGTVRVRGELWNALAEDAPLESGAEIIVTDVDGLRLTVKRDPASIKLLPAARAESTAASGEPTSQG
jgi:membrane-bound serine protease (ClpP class)